MIKNPKASVLKWIVWSLAVTFFFYEFIIRVAPSVMVSDLMKAFAISATGVGNLAAYYLYIYSPMQIPVGVLTDHYGARKLLTIAALACGIGCILFSFAVELWMGALGRLLMGFGSAFGFVGMVYISSHWFSKEKLAFLIGTGNSIGMLGAVLGQGPTSLSVHYFGWRGTFFAYGLIGILLAFIIFILVRNDPPSLKKKEEKKREKSPHILHYLKIVCKNKYTWLNAVACFLFYATTVAFAGLWGVPFLKNVHALPESVAGFAISMIFLGWFIGGPFLGHYSDKLKKRKPLLLIFPVLAFFALSPVIFISLLPTVVVFILLFLVGLFSSAEILHFTVAIEINPSYSKGTAVAFTNFMTMIGGAVLQPLIGYMLDLNWDGTTIKDVPVYSIEDWKIAMSLFPAALLLCFILNLFLKDKKDHKHVEADISY